MSGPLPDLALPGSPCGKADAGRRTTVLLSVPFVRNARFLLSSSAFARLQREFDVVIVSPFADAPAFREEFDGPNTSFVTIEEPRHWLGIRLWGLTESARFMGFWYRHRASTTVQYWAEGRGRGLRGWLRTLGAALSEPPRLWRLLDRCVAPWAYDGKALDAAVTGPAVTVLTANWGYQSRLLAHWSARRGIPRVLLPYTTDQLIINGHLVADFDAICVQGGVERDCATVLHGVSPERIVDLGSIWFRIIDEWRERTVAGNVTPEQPRLLYAGVSSQYFPKLSEWAALQALTNAVANGTLPPVDLVYRPIATEDELVEIRRRCRMSGITLQTAEPVMFTMYAYGDGGTSIAAQIDSYLSDLTSVDVFVMSNTTTMALDALYLDIPVVANFGNLDLTRTERRSHPRLARDPVGLLDSGIAIVLDPQELVYAVRDALPPSDVHASAREITLQRWDAESAGWTETLVLLLKRLGAEATR